MAARLLRSVLYLPASSRKMIDKAVSLRQCDAFIFDCEDAVARDSKLEARSGVSYALDVMNAHKAGRTVVVRVNGIDTEWFQGDCEVARGADAVLLPKAESATQLTELRQHIGEKPDIWAMIETPRGVLNAQDIAQAASVLVMGKCLLQASCFGQV